MEFSVEKYVSNFIRNQFPRFYQEEGENFILFVKAYYEYLETESVNHEVPDGGPIAEARELLSYRDIDSTLEKFLEFFQKKYLYGIPFNVITSKRFLLKHILDVYRSKGTIQCYRLLFKLIYDEDIEIYLPGRDILKASDGIWVEPKYLEVTNNGDIQKFIGQTIVGISSGTTAVVENYVQESFNYDIINIVYISNMTPQGGDFTVGEALVLQSDIANTAARTNAPVVLGSLDYLNIINGGQNFKIGDILKISNKSLETNQIDNYGSDGYVKVTSLARGFGTLNFNIVRGGFGFTTNSNIFIYNNPEDYTGNGASFAISSLSSTREIQYNTDLICDIPDVTIDAASYGFAKYPSGNSATPIANLFSYSNSVFGSIFSLSDIKTGNGYVAPANVFIRSTLLSNTMAGSVTYYSNSMKLYTMSYVGSVNSPYSNGDYVTIVNPVGINAIATIATNTSGGDLTFTYTNRGNNITTNTNVILVSNSTGGNSSGNGAIFRPRFSHCVEGSGTDFARYFVNNDIIHLKANSFLSSTEELQVIKHVANSEFLWLYGPTKNNSTASAEYRVAPVILPSNFAYYEQTVKQTDGSTAGVNESITASPASGNDVVSAVKLVGSGKGYSNGQIVKAYLYGAVSNTINIEIPGAGYQTGDALVFSGGDSGTVATGYVVANGVTGAIENTVITFAGSGYSSIPNVRIQSNTGSGAFLTTSITEFNTTSEITGRVVKKGSGKARGFWNTTRGFLNSDKYIQDSYYYQDYSYEISVARTLEDYKKILYTTFHTTGNELFGKYFVLNRESSNVEILYESSSATINPLSYLTIDSLEFKIDSTSITVDEYIEP
jgi:hypothetical protein